jgi:hypothetical protein
MGNKEFGYNYFNRGFSNPSDDDESSMLDYMIHNSLESIIFEL